MSQRIRSRDFRPSLHGLRGLAVLYVVFSHLGNAGLSLGPVPHDSIGKVGVWIFFGLSAYLLTSHLIVELERGKTSASLLRYAVHRVFRIYPLFLVVLLLHVAIGDMTWGDMLQHVALLKGKAELWAISTEFQYYLVIPLLAIMNRKVAIATALLALVVSVAYTIHAPGTVTASAVPLLPKAAPFLLASLLALMKLPGRYASAIGWVSLVLLLGCTVAFRAVAHDRALFSIMPWITLAISVTVIGLLYALPQSSALSRIFRARWLVWLGEISFSLYLLHLFVIRGLRSFSLPPTLTAWLALATSILVASASYLIIERQGIRAGKGIGQWVSRRFETHDSA